MQVTRKSRWRNRIDNTLFRVLFLAAVGLLAWLSTRYDQQIDWTAGGRNTLAPASISIVQSLQGPVQIRAYARDSEMAPLRRHIGELVAKYQRYQPTLALEFINPDEHPDEIRRLGVINGELIVRYQGREERVRNVDEQNLSNALVRVQRSGTRSIVFLSGHGERDPGGKANHDLGEFGAALSARGLNAQSVTLAQALALPEDTAVLVIAGPRVDLLPGEIGAIEDYISAGGNLLWLTDPDDSPSLAPVAAALGVDFIAGTVVDATAQMLGIGHPAIVVVTTYPRHALISDFANVTLFPFSRALNVEPPAGWQGQPLLVSAAQSWAETGPMSGEVAFDPDQDTLGPLNIGWVLTRPQPAAESGEDAPGTEQRVVIIGDGDFLSNAYLGNAGNLDLGLSLVNWLSRDDSFIAIPAKVAPDRTLELSQATALTIGGLFLVALPLGLMVSGVVIWLRRRRR